MKLSQRHQATFDVTFPDGYDAKRIAKPSGTIVDESAVFHIMYIDIRRDGERTRDVPCVQKYSVQDWEKTKKVFEENGIHVTGHNEYAVIHDPIEAKEAIVAVKVAKAEEAKKKAEAMRAAKAEKAEAKREATANVKPEPNEALK